MAKNAYGWGRTALPSRLRHFSDVEAAWLGALWEGEGSVSLRDRSAQLCIDSTEIETIATCLRLAGCGKILFRAGRESPPRKNQWRWQLWRRNEVLAFCDQVEPYVTSRHGHIARVREHLLDTE